MSKKYNIILTVIVVIISLLLPIVCLVGVLQEDENKLFVNTDFVITDTLSNVSDKKAYVILLNGQSNASGVSLDVYLKQNVSEQKYQVYENGFDNVYINYFNDNGLNKSDGFVKVKTNQGYVSGYFGPELGLAEKLNELHPDKMFFIIKYSWSGSNLFEQWLSPSSKGKTGLMYNAFKKFTDLSMKYLISKGYQVSVNAMCWMQGESDAFGVQAENYEYHLKNLVNDVRQTFGSSADNGGMAFVDAYISDSPYWSEYQTINKAKENVKLLSKSNYCIDTISEGLTYLAEPVGAPDLAHYDSLSCIKLGGLFADKILEFLNL